MVTPTIAFFITLCSSQFSLFVHWQMCHTFSHLRILHWLFSRSVTFFSNRHSDHPSPSRLILTSSVMLSLNTLLSNRNYQHPQHSSCFSLPRTCFHNTLSLFFCYLSVSHLSILLLLMHCLDPELWPLEQLQMWECLPWGHAWASDWLLPGIPLPLSFIIL